MAGSEKHLLILYAQTYLHPGAGSTTGVVDLPIQREVHTQFPYIAGSGLKGSLRDKAEGLTDVEDNAAKVRAVFGPEAKASDDYASCIAVGDAKILAMPVRSLAHTFFWVTSPVALARFQRDCEMAGIPDVKAWQIPQVNTEHALVPPSCQITSPLMLEELNVTVTPDEAVGRIAADISQMLPEHVGDVFRKKFTVDFAVLSDDDFTHLARFGTQVAARIALNERKTTSGDGGNLWYEEYIPPETVFYSLLLVNDPRNGALAGTDKANADKANMSKSDASKPVLTTSAQAMDYLKNQVLKDGYLQVGGNETQGQGWCLTKVR